MSSLAPGDPAPDFSLPGVDGKTWRLADVAESEPGHPAPAFVVIFSCNHCPYVKAYEDRLIAAQAAYRDRGVRFVAINSNETENYPEDRFEEMVKRAKAIEYNFPYLRDESQAVAKAYGAMKTPHLFVFDRERRLRYSGAPDNQWQDPAKVTRRYLQEALDALLAGRPVQEAQTHPVGCTVKWRKT